MCWYISKQLIPLKWKDELNHIHHLLDIFSTVFSGGFSPSVPSVVKLSSKSLAAVGAGNSPKTQNKQNWFPVKQEVTVEMNDEDLEHDERL